MSDNIQNKEDMVRRIGEWLKNSDLSTVYMTYIFLEELNK